MNSEVERIKKNLEARRPAWEHKEQVIRDSYATESHAIRILESRVRNQSFDLDLGDGAKIGIRSNLSIAEVDRLGEIIQSRGEIFEEMKKIVDKNKTMSSSSIDCLTAYRAIVEDLWLEIISIITVDPGITFQFLKDNQELYSKEDTLMIYMAYQEGQRTISEKRKEKVQQSISFRENT